MHVWTYQLICLALYRRELLLFISFLLIFNQLILFLTNRNFNWRKWWFREGIFGMWNKLYVVSDRWLIFWHILLAKLETRNYWNWSHQYLTNRRSRLGECFAVRFQWIHFCNYKFRFTSIHVSCSQLWLRILSVFSIRMFITRAINANKKLKSNFKVYIQLFPSYDSPVSKKWSKKWFPRMESYLFQLIKLSNWFSDYNKMNNENEDTL